MSDYKLEVEKLTKEIKNLKADKDFVWTLWKRLQLSTPDITEAMGLVVQREKEKSEASLTELMEEIQRKNERIMELQDAFTSKENEVKILTKSKEDLSRRSLQLEHQCSDLTMKASKLECLMKKQDEKNQRDVVIAYEQERKELLNTISSLQSQITMLREEKNNLKLENVEYQEKITNEGYLKDSLSRILEQMEDANVHISTQEETIQLLRDQLEHNIQFEKNCQSQDGYSSDKTEEYQSKRRRKVSATESQSLINEERPISPIEDINYKVDRLTVHMRQLQQCVSNRNPRQLQTVSRSNSTPPKRNYKNNNQKEENCRKIQFLTQKLSKTEAMLEEEKKNCTSATEFLKKANSRMQSSQLTIKQLRKQIEDNKLEENGCKNVISDLQNKIEKYKCDIRIKESDINKLNQNALNDASRIQDLLNMLEKTRYELTENKIALQHEDSSEIDRLKDLVRQLEIERSNLEMKLSSKNSEMKNTKVSNQINETRPSSKSSKNKRIRILSKKPKRIGSRKIKSMQSILNHFSGDVGDCESMRQSKDDEWEDDSMEELEEEGEVLITERSQTSSTSTGTKVARIAAHNSRYRKQSIEQSKRGLAKENHISRIQEARDKSQDRDIGGGCYQCGVFSSRISSLQQQLKAVSLSRDGYKSKMKNNNRQIKLIHSDLMQAKARCERLVDAIKKQSGRIQILTEERRQLLGNVEQSFSHERMWQEIGIDNADVVSIAKAHLDEVSSQVTLVRGLQQELSQRDIQLVQLREKLDRIERENSCKKRIIEDLRSKLQCLDGIKDREKCVVDAKGKKYKEMEESISRLKTQLESLQTRFNVVLNERRKFEYEASNLSIKYEASERKGEEVKQAKKILEIQLSKIDQEKEVKMSEIMSRSELALDRASQQIQCYKIKCSKYENLIVNLARHLSDKSREIRRLIEFGQNSFRKLDSSKSTSVKQSGGYDFARSKAADILSLSTSEIDSLLNGERRTSNTYQEPLTKQKNNSSESNTDFSIKCKSIFKKDSFEQDIQTIFLEELDKIVELVAPISSDSGCFSAS